MNLLFLDIDGVLNSERSWKSLGTWFKFAPECVQALNWLLAETGAKVVISSTWRTGGVEFLRQFFEREGIVGCDIIGHTPLESQDPETGLYYGHERGYDIERWLREHGQEVECFVILDDNNDMLHLKSRLVPTHMKIGLTMDDARRAAAMLGGQS